MLLDLAPQSFAETVHGKLGSTVHGAHGHAHQARDRQDVHYLAIATGNHIKQEALSEGDVRKAVGVHHVLTRAELCIGELFTHGQASVVDQDVDTLDALCLLQALVRQAQVHLQDFNAGRVTRLGLDAFELHHPTCCYDNFLGPKPHEAFGHFFSYARAASGDQDGFAIEAWLARFPNQEVVIGLISYDS